MHENEYLLSLHRAAPLSQSFILPSSPGHLPEPQLWQDPPPGHRSGQEPDFGVLGGPRLLHPLRDFGDPLHDSGGGRG